MDRTQRCSTSRAQQRLLQGKPVLGSVVESQAPYVDAKSRLQSRAPTELRAAGAGDGASDDLQQWRRLPLLTVNGSAAGLQTAG